ncbi:MAG: tol-pal system protein YbgF [Betaproteobacteria bacterium]|nr:tol-pal system protein YbgF [Betaproteobacteria bacterium]
MRANSREAWLKGVFSDGWRAGVAQLSRCVPVAVLLGTLLAAQPLRAQLFDDNEARRRIESLRGRVEISQRVVDERLGKLEAAVQDKRALLDLAALIDALRQDMAKLRGQVEVLLNQTETLERRQRDLYVDLGARLRKMEQAQTKLEQGQAKFEQAQAKLEQATAQVQERLAAPEREAAREKESYEAGLNQFKQGNYGASIAAFKGFMSTFPNSQLLPSAQYWIGNAHYALRDFKTAIAAQERVVQSWPHNAKAPDALLNIASSQLESGDVKAARETLQLLVKRYPASPAAEQAKQRLGRR